MNTTSFTTAGDWLILQSLRSKMCLSPFRVFIAWTAILLVAAAGCDSSGSTSDSGGQDMDQMASMLDQPQAAEPAKPAATPARPVRQPAAEVAATQPPAQPARTPAEAAQPRATEVVQEQGQPQVIGQRKYRNTVEGPLRYYGAMASARMVIKDQLLWAQIKKSQDLYEATTGQYPKNTKEFMDKIIEPNMIELPELPAGQGYFYDPSDHELKIGQLAEPPAGDPSAPQ